MQLINQQAINQRLLTIAGSVGDFIDVSEFALIADAARVTASVRTLLTVLRAFYMYEH